MDTITELACSPGHIVDVSLSQPVACYENYKMGVAEKATYDEGVQWIICSPCRPSF